MSNQIVVAGAVVAGSRVLVAQRRYPAELAGRWELPGGKVAPDESEPVALARELAEELDVDAAAVEVGRRLGDDVALDERTVLRAYLVSLARGEPRPRDHRALRWVGAGDLAGLDWVPADRAWLPELTRTLTTG